MDSTNRGLALFVGLFIVILIVGVGLSRLAKNKKPLTGSLGKIFTSLKTTPTPTRKPDRITIITSPTGTVSYDKRPKEDASGNETYSTTSTPSSIPDTGAETLPLISFVLGTGIYLIKRSRA